MAKNYVSPQQSPRDDIELGSTYALQIALRNLKERYHKLQRKLSFIEEENQRLVHGKTELFGEIGLIQENSIKLREKNLQLNQEIHSKHQENCSLRDNFNSLSHQNVTLLNDKKKLQIQVTNFLETNRTLQERINNLTGSNTTLSPLTLDVDERGLSPDSITLTPMFTVANIDSDANSEDSIDQSKPYKAKNCKDSSVSLKAMFEATEDASDRMDKIMDEIQRQNIALRDLYLSASSPLEEFTGVYQPTRMKSSNGSLVSSQKDRDLSTITVNDNQLEEAAEEDAINSRLATCGSVIVRDQPYYTGNMLVTNDLINNVAETSTVHQRPNSPFDWRKVKISDDDASPLHSDEGSDYSSDQKTSPTIKLTNKISGGLQLNSPVINNISPATALEDDAKICPMCNQSFSREITQDMFENHVIAHFEDINVGFEVV